MKNKRITSFLATLASIALLTGCGASSSNTPSSSSKVGVSSSSSSSTQTMIYDDAKSLMNAFDDCLFNHKTSFSLSYHSDKFDFDPSKILTYSSFYDDCIDSKNYTKTNDGVDPTVLHFPFSYNTPGLTADSEPSSYAEGLNVASSKMAEARGEVGGTLPIDGREKTFNVTDSEQLYYAVSKGYKPVCSGSATTIYEKAKDVYSKIIGASFSDEEKVTAIYDWIGGNVRYDEDGLKKKSEGGDTYKNADNSYLEGVFNRGLAVCEGYSKAFTLLCGMAGLECYRVVGDKPSNNSLIGHAWNYVKVGDKWFASDPTANNIQLTNSSGGLETKFELGNHDLMLTTKENLQDLGYVQRSLVYPDTTYSSTYYYEGASLSKNEVVTLTVKDEASFLKLFNLLEEAESAAPKYIEFLDKSNGISTYFDNAVKDKTDSSLYTLSTERHAIYYCPVQM